MSIFKFSLVFKGKCIKIHKKIIIIIFITSDNTLKVINRYTYVYTYIFQSKRVSTITTIWKMC